MQLAVFKGCLLAWFSFILTLMVSLASSVSNTSDSDSSIQVSAVPTFANQSALDEYCNSIIDVFFKTYIATHIATTLVVGYEGYGPTDSRGFLTGPVTSQSDWTSTLQCMRTIQGSFGSLADKKEDTEYPIRAYTAKPPCCSQCYLTAGTMQLLYWPDQASASTPAPGAISTSVNADGFTFTSPSVYMAFSSLQASDKCGIVGDIWTNKTMAFEPDEITTINPTLTSTFYATLTSKHKTITSTIYSSSQKPDGPIDYASLKGNCSSIASYEYWPGDPFNDGMGAYYLDPCHPVLKLPKRLLTAQEAWASKGCVASPGAGGFYDPPQTMTTAAVFALPSQASQKTSAAPAPASSADIASQTAGPHAGKDSPVSSFVAHSSAATLGTHAETTASDPVATGDVSSVPHSFAPQSATSHSTSAPNANKKSSGSARCIEMSGWILSSIALLTTIFVH